MLVIFLILLTCTTLITLVFMFGVFCYSLRFGEIPSITSKRNLNVSKTSIKMQNETSIRKEKR